MSLKLAWMRPGGEIAVAAPPADDGTLYGVLMKGPDVGDDADFKRPRDRETMLYDLIIQGPDWARTPTSSAPPTPDGPRSNEK